MLIAVVALLLSGAAWVIPPAAEAATPRWVALGDSYSAGEGAGEFAPDEARFFDPGTLNGCNRSPYAYPPLLGPLDSMSPDVRRFHDNHGLATLGHDLTHVACGGAVIDDVLRRKQRGADRPQIDHLTDDTDLVTVTIGGNNMGFSRIGATCLTPPRFRGGARTCQQIFEAENLNRRIDDLEGPLSSLYRELLGRAPNARLFVVGYPQIVGAPSPRNDVNRYSNPWYCSAHLSGTAAVLSYQMEASDRIWIRGIVARLNSTIKRAVANAVSLQQAAGRNSQIHYTDMESVFEPEGPTASEAFCGTQRRTNGAKVNVTFIRERPFYRVDVNHNSLHPTREGYAAMAARLFDTVQARPPALTHRWAWVRQDAFTDSSKQTRLDTANLRPGQRGWLVVKARNTGTATWFNGGEFPVRLGTDRRRDRTDSAFYDPGWLSRNRPARLVEASVAPGGEGTFEFPITAPRSGRVAPFREYFNLVADGLIWFNDLGLYFELRMLNYQWRWAGQQAYTDASKTGELDLGNLRPGQRGWLVVRARNTGTATWSSTGEFPVRLGTDRRRDRTDSAFYDPGWLSRNRPAGLKESSVAPGGEGTFEFPITAPRSGRAAPFRESFNLVADGLTWFNDRGLYFELRVISVVGIAATPDGGGYWLVAADGGVFTYGNARFFGSAADVRLQRPVVGMAATPDGGGYWLVAADGGVFTYGNARFFGSAANERLNQPVVGMAATPDGGGYWLVAADGGVFTYGNARFVGSAADRRLNQPVVGMAATPDGGGYWLVAADGGVFTFGNARFHGSAVDRPIGHPVVGMAAHPRGDGYWLVANEGTIRWFAADGPVVASLSVPPPNPRDWRLNGAARLDGASLVLTPADNDAAGSAFYTKAVKVEGLHARFTAVLDGGSGADGLTLAFLDPTASTPTALGGTGGLLGFAGLTGTTVALDTWPNGNDPSDNFVGIATGTATTGYNEEGPLWVATTTAVPRLLGAPHQVEVGYAAGRLRVSLDGSQVLDTAVDLPSEVLVGFTAATGDATDVHTVRDVTIAPGS